MKYPFAPLAALMGLTEPAAGVQLGISGRTEQEYRRDGMSEKVADRMACKAGLHPFSVWPDMATHVTEAEEARRRSQRTAATLKWRHKPEPAERARQIRRAYYANCGDYERQRERNRYWANRDAILARRRERRRAS